jgi:hypothetical protein
MLKEENSLIGGNASINLGTAVAPTLSAAGTGATLPALTYSVIVVAMTFEGYKNITTIAAGLTQTKTITGQDGSPTPSTAAMVRKARRPPRRLRLVKPSPAQLRP